MNLINFLKYRLLSLIYLLRYFFLNIPSSLIFFYFKKKNSKDELEIINDLKTKGYHKCSLEDLFGLEDAKRFLNEFDEIVSQGYKQKIFINKEEEYKKNNLDGKNYLFKFIENINDNLIPFEHPLIKIGTSTKILNIINGFYEKICKLQGIEIWHTFFSDKNKNLQNAQRWHRDRDDLNVVKIFLYLNDVDKKNGALEYIPDSLRKKKYQNLSRFPFGTIESWKVYPRIDVKKLNQKDIVSLEGKRGTIVFVNTIGLHRGGKATYKKRLMCMWSYVTPASLYAKKKFKLQDISLNKLSVFQKFAIR